MWNRLIFARSAPCRRKRVLLPPRKSWSGEIYAVDSMNNGAQLFQISTQYVENRALYSDFSMGRAFAGRRPRRQRAKFDASRDRVPLELCRSDSSETLQKKFSLCFKSVFQISEWSLQSCGTYSENKCVSLKNPVHHRRYSLKISVTRLIDTADWYWYCWRAMVVASRRLYKNSSCLGLRNKLARWRK